MNSLLLALMSNVSDHCREQAEFCVGWFLDKPKGSEVDVTLIAQKLAIWLQDNAVTGSELKLIVKSLECEKFMPGIAEYEAALKAIRPEQPSDFERRWAGAVAMLKDGIEVMVQRSDVERAKTDGYVLPAMALGDAESRERAVEAGKRVMRTLLAPAQEASEEDHGAKVFEQLRRQSC